MEFWRSGDKVIRSNFYLHNKKKICLVQYQFKKFKGQVLRSKEELRRTVGTLEVSPHRIILIILNLKTKYALLWGSWDYFFTEVDKIKLK